MHISYSRLTLGLVASATLAACAGNPSPEDTAAADTTAPNAGVMAAPSPDTTRRDTTIITRDTSQAMPADSAMVPPTDTTMMPPARDTSAMVSPTDTAAMPPLQDTTAMPADTSMAMAASGAAVTAKMEGAAGRDLGTLTLTESGGGIAVSGQLVGLPPGEHGFHVHAVGKCEGPSFESAGAHWNPTNKAHGTDNPAGPHLGDLQNLTVGDDSSVTVHATTPSGTLHGENPLLDGDGAAIVIHAAADDYQSNPAGNSGKRIACGVVQGS